MKLEDRERIEGTAITIGRRVNYSQGKRRVSKRYAAEYRDDAGRQVCENLKTQSRLEARRLALEIHARIEAGQPRVVDARLTIDDLIDAYFSMVKARGLAPKSQSKYDTDLKKIKTFCHEEQVALASRFNRELFFKYREWLLARNYADKTVYTALILCKQVFKWGYQESKLRDYKLGNAKVAKARAKPQPCFTTEQVELLVSNAEGIEKAAYATLAYAGLRIGELVQLRWVDVQMGRGDLGMFHIRRGGSVPGRTKDKDERFVPIHPRVRPFLEKLPRNQAVVFPGLTERNMLSRLKRLCREVGFGDWKTYKLHSFRHHFASLCANHAVAYRKALAWLGHSSSEILDLYYHLNDADSQAAMRSLADDGFEPSPPAPLPPVEGNLRAKGQSIIETDSEVSFDQAFTELLDREAERAGFEPAVGLIALRRFSKPLPSATRPPLQRSRSVPRSHTIPQR